MARSLLALLVAMAPLIAQDTIAIELAPQGEFVAQYCFECHGDGVAKGKLDLGAGMTDPVDKLFRLSQMRTRVAASEMPPVDPDDKEGSGPTTAERTAFSDWVDEVLRREVPLLPSAPGRVTIRRLNESQWRRTIRDLFGVAVSTAGFPNDDLVHGFDTVGDAMTFSTLHLEKYLAAAGALAEEVLTGEDPDNPQVRHFEAEAMRVGNERSAGMSGDYANLYSQTHLDQPVRLRRDGVYRVRVSARSTPAGPEEARMVVSLDAEEVATAEVSQRRFHEFEWELRLSRGEHRIRLAFANDYYDPDNADKSRRDRNLHIDWCELIGPIDPPVIPPKQRWLHAALPATGDDTTRLQEFTRSLLPRVWRRPVTGAESRRHAAVGEAALDEGDSLVGALRLVLQSALTSPNFLFRGELHRVDVSAETIEPVPSVVMASRLSYFLWASTPDKRLAELGQNGRLTELEVLLSEARRLLDDPRADSLASEFAAQWFELDNLTAVTPDPDRFPGFSEALRRAARAETEMLFLAVQREGRDVRELLDADFTYVDRTLAEFYGIPFPATDDDTQLVRVDLPEQQPRAGLLGHASILAVTSNPTRTSPVKRGKWILENLLDAAPPPPPPGNDALPDEAAAVDNTRSFREQLAQHRQSRRCAVCHVRMDALGLALERFDAIGRYRERDSGGVIDASGRLPDGSVIDGLADLAQLLRGDPAFVHTFARKLFVYGVGRAPRPVDLLQLDQAVAQLLSSDKVEIDDLVLALVSSDAFRLRRVLTTR